MVRLQFSILLDIVASYSKLPNSSPPGQNSRHFAKDVFTCIFVNEKFCILIWISLICFPKGPLDNNQALD